jgi:hypothetical protein
MKTFTRFTCACVAMFALSFTAIASAQVATTDASKFIGTWALGLDTPQGSMAMNLTLKDTAGKVTGSMTSDMAPGAQAITDITKDGDKLVLKYDTDFQGQAIPTVVTIAPAGDKWTANFDFAGGQFQMDGTAVKK